MCLSVVVALFESSMCLSVVVGTWQAQRKATFTNAHAPTTNSTWRLTQDTRSVHMNVISSSASFKDVIMLVDDTPACVSQCYTKQVSSFMVTADGEF